MFYYINMRNVESVQPAPEGAPALPTSQEMVERAGVNYTRLGGNLEGPSIDFGSEVITERAEKARARLLGKSAVIADIDL